MVPIGMSPHQGIPEREVPFSHLGQRMRDVRKGDAAVNGVIILETAVELFEMMATL